MSEWKAEEKPAAEFTGEIWICGAAMKKQTGSRCFHANCEKPQESTQKESSND